MGEVYQISYVPFTLLPFELHRRRHGGAHLFSRHDLSVAPGREAQAGGSASLRIAASPMASRDVVHRSAAVLRSDEVRCNQDTPQRKSLFPNKIAGTLLDKCILQGESTMRTALWSNCGSSRGRCDARVIQPRRAPGIQSRIDAAPTTQMVIGPDGIARPYAVQAGQTALGQPLPGNLAWSPTAR